MSTDLGFHLNVPMLSKVTFYSFAW
jgi:hypothetical protein